jgi:isoamylase
VGFSANPGHSFPLGATVYPEGVNFSVFSNGANGIELLLFGEMDSPRPERVITLDPRKNRTYHYWHVFVPGLKAGQIYGYRVAGPWAPEKGARFDPGKVLLDPYGQAGAVPPGSSRDLASGPGKNTGQAMKSKEVLMGNIMLLIDNVEVQRQRSQGPSDFLPRKIV